MKVIKAFFRIVSALITTAAVCLMAHATYCIMFKWDDEYYLSLLKFTRAMLGLEGG